MAISGKKLAALRDALLLSQDELGPLIGMTGGNLSRLENETATGMNKGSFRKLAELAKISIDELRVRIGVNGQGPDAAGIDPTHESVPEVPTIEFDTSAGPWIQTSICQELNYDDPVQRWIIETGRFRMRIRGDSMAPKFKSGMTIEFKILRADESPTLKRAYAVCRDDGCATFKLLKEITDDEWVLTAINRRKYPDEIRVARQQIVRVAEAVDVIERIEW